MVILVKRKVSVGINGTTRRKQGDSAALVSEQELLTAGDTRFVEIAVVAGRGVEERVFLVVKISNVGSVEEFFSRESFGTAVSCVVEEQCAFREILHDFVVHLGIGRAVGCHCLGEGIGEKPCDLKFLVAFLNSLGERV